MTQLLLFIVIYFAGCLAYFQLIQRPLFIAYNRKESTRPITIREMCAIARYGFKSDIIVCSYLTAIPLIAASVQAFVPTAFLHEFMVAYSIVTGIVIGTGTMVDIALYPFWKFKLDACVLPDLKSI